MREPAFIWRLLTGPELTDVYLNEMRRDFPAGELKPLSMILNSEADGTAHTWGVFDGDTLAAYLLMVRPEGCRMSQLDYFAVVPAYRAHGIGAQLLAQLPAHEDPAAAILIEAEMPERSSSRPRCRKRPRTQPWQCGGWAFTPAAARGTPTTPSIFLTRGSAFWCWTARAARPLPRRLQWKP